MTLQKPSFTGNWFGCVVASVLGLSSIAHGQAPETSLTHRLQNLSTPSPTGDVQLVSHNLAYTPVFSDGEAADAEADKDDVIKDLTERLEEMEDSWGDFQDKLAKDAADKKKKSSYKITGRVHFDYWNFMNNSPGIGFFEHDDPGEANFGTDPEDRWLFRRIRLEMAGNVPQGMRFRFQIDFNNPSTPEYTDVYIGWDNLPCNQ